MKNLFYSVRENVLDWFTLTFRNPFGVKPGGACPVQAEGTVGNIWYYFRSRGTGWSLDIAESEKDWVENRGFWRYAEAGFKWPDAGWISKREAVKFATKALKKYFNERNN